MRGHIYLSYGLYKCYNDNSCSCSLVEFFDRFGIDSKFSQSELHELQKIATNSRVEIYNARQSVSTTEIDGITPHLLSKQEIIDLYDAVEIEKDSWARGRISSRQIPSYKNEFLLWLPSQQCLVILNMHINTQKVVSIVKRQMAPNFRGPKYLTVQYSELLAVKHGLKNIYGINKVGNKGDIISLSVISEKSGVPEEIIKKLDVTCQFFNVFNVDWGDDVYVFEGPIDSFFMPNSIALSTSGVELTHPTFHYIYDDDATGRKQAYKMLDKRLPVFMWKKFLNENPIYKKPHVTKRDFNDMWLIQHFSPDFIKQYFTSNPLNKLQV